MSVRTKYEKELAEVFDKLNEMCLMTEEAIEKSVKALQTRDKELAREVMREDKNIDDTEREIEHDCLRILLMERPVASDFRDVSAALKMITDLERIGDQAEDIAETVSFIDSDHSDINGLLIEMAKSAMKMVTESVDAFVKCDIILAEKVVSDDDGVDGYFAAIKKRLIARISESPADGESDLNLLMIAKYFERIGDHAVNVAHWVMFSITGEHREKK